MPPGSSPLSALLAAYAGRQSNPLLEAQSALQRANGNAGRNTYITLDPEWTLAEARQQAECPAGLLSGIPVSLKDCFDLQGFPTSLGSRFYAQRWPSASADSAVAARLRRSGAVIIGKSHLHQLTYGITGENPDYGDCLQPASAALLTGGSSSGAAASVQEGSAVAAIGTDTGGSVRLPAALCGLAGYRSSLGAGDWRGGHHLAPSFDTIGWLFRDLRDAPLLAEALFDLPPDQPEPAPPRVAVLAGDALEDCEPGVREAVEQWKERLSRSAIVETVEAPDFWFGAWDIYAPLQAAEAARIHAGLYEQFDPVIAGRLRWGASLTEDELQSMRERHARYRQNLHQLFRQFDLVLAPVTPVGRLIAGMDHSDARRRILRHTTPASLGGLPTLVLPSGGCGLQLMAAHNDDRRLLRVARRLGEAVAEES